MAEKKKVLVIDDDPSIGAMVEVALGENYDVLKAENAEEGMAKLNSDSPDCVILDIMMPGDSGVTMLAKLSQNPKLAQTPIIMCSGVAQDTGVHVDENELGEYVGLKPKAFIEKPVNPDDLIKTVQDVIG
mgnify:CR=1 FL=1